MIRQGDKIIMTEEEIMEMHRNAIAKGLEHADSSPKTKEALQKFMENQDLILDTIKELKKDLCERIDKSDRVNAEQHVEIIRRQDHTNGSIAEANVEIAETKKKQRTLRIVLATVFIMLAILGLMPERLYQLLKGVI